MFILALERWAVEDCLRIREEEHFDLEDQMEFVISGWTHVPGRTDNSQHHKAILLVPRGFRFLFRHKA